MQIKILVIYFLIGGFLMSGIMYFGIQGKGYWSALLALLPIWTILPLITLYYHSGIESVLSYSQGLILVTVPWLLYASCLVWFVPYFGVYISSIIGLSLYIVCALLINWLRKI